MGIMVARPGLALFPTSFNVALCRTEPSLSPADSEIHLVLTYLQHSRSCLSA